MRGSELLDKMNLVDPAYIEAAASAKKKKRNWIPIGIAAAACIALIICTTQYNALFHKGQPNPLSTELQELSVTEFQARGYSVVLAKEAENVKYHLLTRGEETMGQVTFTLDGDDYNYRICEYDKANESADLSDLENGASTETVTVNNTSATLSYDDDGIGKIYWADANAGYAYTISMENGATKEKLMRAAEPLENHAQVHEVADNFTPEQESQIFGCWKYDQYNAYIVLNEDNTYYFLGADLVPSESLELKVMDECVVLYNQWGGEDTVLYFTKDGKFVDAGGDGLTKTDMPN